MIFQFKFSFLDGMNAKHKNEKILKRKSKVAKRNLAKNQQKRTGKIEKKKLEKKWLKNFSTSPLP